MHDAGRTKAIRKRALRRHANTCKNPSTSLMVVPCVATFRLASLAVIGPGRPGDNLSSLRTWRVLSIKFGRSPRASLSSLIAFAIASAFFKLGLSPRATQAPPIRSRTTKVILLSSEARSRIRRFVRRVRHNDRCRHQLMIDSQFEQVTCGYYDSPIL